MSSAIDQAIQAVKSNPRALIRPTARAFGVAPSTLSRRLNGGLTRREGHTSQQLLSTAQEEMLVDWVLEQERLGHAPTHARVREFAAQIRGYSGEDPQVGENWLTRFMQRNPAIRTKIGRKIDYQRMQNTQPEVLEPWFHQFKALMDRYQVDPANIWNMDESGLDLGRCTNQRVVRGTDSKRTYVKSPETREWITIIEVINALKSALRPTVIFKGQSVQTTWFFPNQVPDWLYTTSENGWISNNIGLSWLKEVFLPESAPSDSIQTRVLLLDGHGSHIPTDFMYEYEIHNVKLLYLPAHSSHILQPLDLSIFSLIKHHYHREIDTIAAYDDTGPVKKIRFIQFYKGARNFALTARNIQAGWRGAGLVPYNPKKVLNSQQVQLGQQAAQTPPRSHKRALSNELIYLPTPSNQKELRQTVERLQKNENLSRTVRTALSKISKGYETLHALHARDELRLRGQQVLIDEVRAKRTRKKVAIDPNSKFVRIRDIKEAQDQQDAQKAAWAVKDRAAEARRTANSMLQKDMQAFMHEFSAVDMQNVGPWLKLRHQGTAAKISIGDAHRVRLEISNQEDHTPTAVMRTSRVSQETTKIFTPLSPDRAVMRRSTRQAAKTISAFALPQNGRRRRSTAASVKTEEEEDQEDGESSAFEDSTLDTPITTDIEDSLSLSLSTPRSSLRKRKRGSDSPPVTTGISTTTTTATTAQAKAKAKANAKIRTSPRKRAKSETDTEPSTPSNSTQNPLPKLPARKTTNPDGSVTIHPPSNWQEIYTLIHHMRTTNPTAPVDTMGCSDLYWPSSPPAEQRYHTLTALMLSSQTKDTITAAAMHRLHTQLTPRAPHATHSTLTIPSILSASPAHLNSLITPVGFHNTKTRHLQATAALLAAHHACDIPRDLPSLLALPGVGPKMAYLTLSSAWGLTLGIGVDVHVHRITNLWGWHATRTPEETRKWLEGWLPRERWHEINKVLVGLGQTVCLPVGRRCGECVLAGRGLCRGEVSGGRGKVRRKRRGKVEKQEEEEGAEAAVVVKEEEKGGGEEEKVMVKEDVNE